MNKYLLCALAILLALSAAVPASAQYGYSGTPLEAVTNRNMGMVHGLLRNIDGGYYYGGSYHRSRAGRILHTVFGPEPYYPYGTRPYGYGEETSGKCFERVAKAAKKQRVSITASEIAAYCNGQPLPDRTERNDNEERVSEQEPPSEFQPQETRVFHNCTRMRVYVGNPEMGNGFYLEPGEKRQASASTPVYGNFNGGFRQARIVWQNGLALITAPEGA